MVSGPCGTSRWWNPHGRAAAFPVRHLLDGSADVRRGRCPRGVRSPHPNRSGPAASPVRAKILRLAPRLGEAGPRSLVVSNSGSTLGREASGRSRGVGNGLARIRARLEGSFSAPDLSSLGKAGKDERIRIMSTSGPALQGRAPPFSISRYPPRRAPAQPAPRGAAASRAMRSSDTGQCTVGLRSSGVPGYRLAVSGLLLAFGPAAFAVDERRGSRRGERSERPRAIALTRTRRDLESPRGCSPRLAPPPPEGSRPPPRDGAPPLSARGVPIDPPSP